MTDVPIGTRVIAMTLSCKNRGGAAKFAYYKQVIAVSQTVYGMQKMPEKSLHLRKIKFFQVWKN